MDAVVTISNQSCADPYVLYAHGKFYMTYTAGNRVELWCSDSLLDFENRCSKHKVWQPPGGRPYSGDVWAPELHAIQGRWYIYVSCDDPKLGNKSHRMYVLIGPPDSQDPCAGTFKDGKLGEWHISHEPHCVRNMPDQWAIDGTIIHLQGQMYMVYSGWSLQPTTQDLQQLYIVRLKSPLEADSYPSMISTPDQRWEFSGNKGINEGPQWLAAPDGSWIGLAYSCAGSWTRDYKMATLQYVGGDPLDPRAWRKSREPLICSRDKPPFGPGHGSFLQLEGDYIAIFHGTDNATDGWGNRKARCQRVRWTSDGPHMGGCVGPLTTDLDVFRGISQPPSHSSHHGGMKGFLQKAADKLESKMRDL
ncbi:Arabinanase/levansucrase/invertase [Rhizodiscina lignyota]|uniref:Arabinanase/levansucrase/invertase n=1 Tax=Rhizodiscina lignyota TaxID=1504668 RepID=A0A9P4MAS6_9PEZI|nr:Arabinanase/levansucrase/invertase [Rhizodiscina lignyota]